MFFVVQPTDTYTIKVRKNLLISYVILTDQQGDNDLFHHFLFLLEPLSLSVELVVYLLDSKIDTGFPLGIEDIGFPIQLLTYVLW